MESGIYFSYNHLKNSPKRHLDIVILAFFALLQHGFHIMFPRSRSVPAPLFYGFLSKKHRKDYNPLSGRICCNKVFLPQLKYFVYFCNRKKWLKKA